MRLFSNQWVAGGGRGGTAKHSTREKPHTVWRHHKCSVILKHTLCLLSSTTHLIWQSILPGNEAIQFNVVARARAKCNGGQYIEFLTGTCKLQASEYLKRGSCFSEVFARPVWSRIFFKAFREGFAGQYRNRLTNLCQPTGCKNAYILDPLSKTVNLLTRKT